VSDFLDVAPWAIVTAIVTWIGQAFIYRKDWRKMELDHKANIESSRDDLAIELLSSARAEVVSARSEMETLRDEMKALRSMERHFYHFQQALEHLSAVLFAKDEAEKATAERNARAFLTRMTRLQEAKGTIANEVQRMDAGLKETEKKIRDEGGQV
jgi:predicted  nucleic acid-binding Zn-ribbon protein